MCYIHIGTHKTGTTSIQAFLAANRDRLSAAGVLLPSAGSDGDAGVVSHHELAHELNGSAFDAARGGLKAVADELRRSSAHTACLSSEDFTFLWDKPAELERLRDDVAAAGYTPRIVVYLRPQAPYAIAIYAENVRHGYRTGFARYLDDVFSRGQYVWGSGCGPPFDYARLLDPFATVFGRDAIVVRRYHSVAPSRALLLSFARTIIPDDRELADYNFPATRFNGSLDFGGVLGLLGVPHAVGERLRFSPLTLLPALRFGLRFRRSNAAVAARYGVAIPALEPLDFALALPLRTTRAKTRALNEARHALARFDREWTVSAAAGGMSPDQSPQPNAGVSRR